MTVLEDDLETVTTGCIAFTTDVAVFAEAVVPNRVSESQPTAEGVLGAGVLSSEDSNAFESMSLMYPLPANRL
jgi:hypothetical protein